MIGLRSTRPSGRRPFHFMMNGTRMPPSHVVRFDPLKGALLDPLIVVVVIVGPPLSLKKTISVFSFQVVFAQCRQHLADSVVQRRHHGGIRAALLILDVCEPRQVLLGRVHGRVDGVEGEIEEEGLGGVLLDVGRPRDLPACPSGSRPRPRAFYRRGSHWLPCRLPGTNGRHPGNRRTRRSRDSSGGSDPRVPRCHFPRRAVR